MRTFRREAGHTNIMNAPLFDAVAGTFKYMATSAHPLQVRGNTFADFSKILKEKTIKFLEFFRAEILLEIKESVSV